MIVLKELVNREYKGKDPIKFTYVLKNERGEPVQGFNFTKIQDAYKPFVYSKETWMLETMCKRTLYADSQVYTIHFDLPKPKMPLTTIAAIGLREFNSVLKDEISEKIEKTMLIVDLLEGMG